jgi:hypothetical protein|eukprot:7333022-Prymnesium_polylepis.1
MYPPLKQLVKSLRSFRQKMVSFYKENNEKLRLKYNQKLKLKGKEGAERSIFAIITHMVENNAMKIIRDYMAENNIEMFAQIYDGLITSKCSETLLRGAEERLSLYGFDLKLKEKPLYGLQDSTITELQHLENTMRVDAKEKNLDVNKT